MDGVNAYTTLVTTVTLPAVAGPVVVDPEFTDASWVAVGQTLFISDETNMGTFTVDSVVGNIVGLTWIDAAGDSAGGAVIAIGGKVSPSGPTWTPSAALPVVFTDNSTGAATDVIAAGAGAYTIAFWIDLATVTAADIITSYVLGHKFKLLKHSFIVHSAVTTVAKAATISLTINGAAVTGGVLDLTSANCTPKGVVVDSTSAITAANTGGAAATLSWTASAVTAFVEGDGWLVLEIQNMDTADAIASLADHIDDLIASLT